jgi:RecA/RadA recombinase
VFTVGALTFPNHLFSCPQQVCHTLCVTAQLSSETGGGNGRVAFIDTENTFRPERIVEIAQRFELDPEDVLDNIVIARAYTSEHQVELLDHVAARMASDRFALLIVDSATALFRVDFTGRGELADRQQKLNRFLSALTKIAEQFGVAVFITNQVMSTPVSTVRCEVARKRLLLWCSSLNIELFLSSSSILRMRWRSLRTRSLLAGT